MSGVVCLQVLDNARCDLAIPDSQGAEGALSARARCKAGLVMYFVSIDREDVTVQ